jgi:hypothetical protein
MDSGSEFVEIGSQYILEKVDPEYMDLGRSQRFYFYFFWSKLQLVWQKV